MWDLKFGPGSIWDDSIVVANLFPAKEGSRTKVPTNESYEKWDCTALFQATIQPQTFALPDSKGNLKTLSELYVKARRFMPHGSFHLCPLCFIVQLETKRNLLLSPLIACGFPATLSVIRTTPRWIENL